jgi:hypothetical protein
MGPYVVRRRLVVGVGEGLEGCDGAADEGVVEF